MHVFSKINSGLLFSSCEWDVRSSFLLFLLASTQRDLTRSSLRLSVDGVSSPDSLHVFLPRKVREVLRSIWMRCEGHFEPLHQRSDM